jgi:hypothetical protein
VLSGENLCLSGSLRPGRLSLEPLELVGTKDSDDAIPVLLHVSLARLPDGSSLLSVQNDTHLPVHWTALTALGASPFLVRQRELRAEPYERAFFSWNEPLERVALFGFEVEPPLQREHERELRGKARVESKGAAAGVGLVGYYGTMPLRLDALSSEIEGSGYSSAPSTTALGGGALWVSLARLRIELYMFGGSNTFRHRATNDHFTMNLLSGGISLGWEAFRHHSLVIYPYAGIARAAISLDDLPRTPFPLPRLKPTPDPEQGVSTGGAQLDLGVAFEQLVTTLSQHRTGYLGASVGMRVGYNVPLSDPGWSTMDPEKDVDYHGGPRSDLGGPYVLFSAGIALRASDF